MSVSSANDAQALVILVVEDEYLVRASIAASLRDAGYVVVEAASGEEAVAMRNRGVSIDIVFTDINLLGSMSGWDVANSFRRECPQVPVLYTSGRPMDPAHCVPGSVCIVKPYCDTDVVHACQQVAARA